MILRSLIVTLMFYMNHAIAADPKLVNAILLCESSNRHYEKDGRVRFGDDGISRGIAQFRKETFYEFAALAIKQHKWPFKYPNWFNEEQQLWLLNWGLDNGYGRRWTCWRKLQNVN